MQKETTLQQNDCPRPHTERLPAASLSLCLLNPVTKITSCFLKDRLSSAPADQIRPAVRSTIVTSKVT